MPMASSSLEGGERLFAHVRDAFAEAPLHIVLTLR
jgi:hypothetical protein